MSNSTKFYSMRNDYMFHMVFQENLDALIAFTAAIMRIDVNEIQSCDIRNPILAGSQINTKTCILDIRLLLNNSMLIDLEMQVVPKDFWVKRSLLYWARTYDTLKKGEIYSELKPTVHVGILNYSLFDDHKKFFSEYKLQDTEDSYLYSEDCCIKILDLTQIDQAKQNEQELVKWARFFAADSFNELYDAAYGSEVLQKMVVTMKELTADEKAQLIMEGRADYESSMKSSFSCGRDKGLSEGISIGRDSLIRTLLKKNSAASVAEMLELPLAIVEGAIDNK